MDEQKQPINFNTLLAFVVLIAIVLLLPVYWEWIGYKAAPKTEPVATDTTATSPSATPEKQPQAIADKSSSQPAQSEQTSDTTAAFFVARADWRNETITVSTPKIDALIATRGGRIVRLVLKDYVYNDVYRRGEPIVLLDTTDTGGPRFEPFSDSLDLADAPFTSDRHSLTLHGDDSATVTLTTQTRAGGTSPSGGSAWMLSYTFFADRHDFRLRLSIPDPWRAGVEREIGYGWTGGLWPTEPSASDDNGHFAAVALMGTDLEKVKDVDKDKPTQTLTGETHWAAVRTKYFVCAVIPSHVGSEFHVVSDTRPWIAPGESATLKQFSAWVRSELRTGEPVDLTWTVYAGPIDYDVLKSHNVGLEEMVDLGWRWIVRPFALLLLWLFGILHSVIPNFGVVIIIFALLIKTVMHPLTKKQMRSMRRMQSLQPRMEKLRERFKKDPQRMNQEMMKMYREAGVNPLSGCLPLLPQMPIFYALFQLFQTTIELRGAHFVGWVTDMSQKDPYYILPIIMTVAMFVQQKLSTKDPKQKMLIYLMPLLFGFLFRNFPAGLNLYWCCYNIFSIIEQVWLIGHPDDESPADADEVGSGRILKTEAAS